MMMMMMMTTTTTMMMMMMMTMVQIPLMIWRAAQEKSDAASHDLMSTGESVQLVSHL